MILIDAAGLNESITVLEVDYRDLTGTYDKLVSIEMIEAVGWKYFPTYFAKCSGLLKPNGAMLLQAITVVDEAYEIEKTSRNFTNSIIFPGVKTSVQDWPGRLGYWDVGVPPSGPMDPLALRLANRLLGNEQGAAGLEITVIETHGIGVEQVGNGNGRLVVHHSRSMMVTLA